ncbi:unnamed protein product [Timema podura]|uniref:Uncharacterized protein n=1 Tax=Timema podura TaxID=61482 RepID=A0ABN7NMK2_TIMPD|nr:unnamed protein product [Timema podura]
MASAKRLTRISTQNQNPSRRSLRLVEQREGVVHETSLQISSDKNTHRGRNPSRYKASCTNHRLKAKIKSEKKNGSKSVLSKKLIKKYDKNEASLDECSSFSLSCIKKMLLAGFAEGRRRAEQLYGLRSGVVEKVSNDVYRVRTDPEKPGSDPTDYDDDDTNKSDSSNATYSTPCLKESHNRADRSETSEDSRVSRKGAERRRDKRRKSPSVNLSRPLARHSSVDHGTCKRRRSDRRKPNETSHKLKLVNDIDQPKFQAEQNKSRRVMWQGYKNGPVSITKQDVTRLVPGRLGPFCDGWQRETRLTDNKPSDEDTTLDRDSKPDLPVIGYLVPHESDALDHAATGAYTDLLAAPYRLNRIDEGSQRFVSRPDLPRVTQSQPHPEYSSRLVVDLAAIL